MKTPVVDAEALALHLGVSKRTLYRWAREDAWTPHGKPRGPGRLWDIGEAEQSLSRRSRTHHD